MKQSIFNLVIAMGVLTITAIACSPENQTTSKLLEGVHEDLSVRTFNDDIYNCGVKSVSNGYDGSLASENLSDEEHQAVQDAFNQSSNYQLIINKDEENDQFIVDLVININDGIKIHFIQSTNGFNDNSTTHVENIELQNTDGALNNTGSVELIDQELNEESLKLTFSISSNSGCTRNISIESSIAENTL